MRCFTIICLLLAITALVSTETRQKRDLTLLRDLFTSAFRRRLFDRPSLLSIDLQPRFYRVPGFSNRVFKVVNRQDALGLVLQDENQNQALQTPIWTFPELTGERETVYLVPSLSDSYDTELKVKAPIESNYSYKQLRHKKPVMTYTAHSNSEVVVSEEIQVRPVLPTCINQRIGDVILIGANPYSVSALYPTQPQASINIEYPKMNAHGKILNEFQLPELINPHKNTKIYVTSPMGSEKISKSLPTTNMFGPPIRSHETIGLIPPPYISSSSRRQNGPTKQVGEDNSSNGRSILANQPIISKYSYKQINHNSAEPITIVKLRDQIYNIPTSVVDSNAPNASYAKLPSGYVFIPPDIQYDSVVTTEKPITDTKIEPKRDSQKITEAVLKVKHDQFKHNPIVVPDRKIYSYQQKNIDGSSISFNGSNNGVSVDLQNTRGDIPEPLM